MDSIRQRLAALFPPNDLKWLPITVTSGRDGPAALAVAYLDARTIMDRLDDTMGIDGWEDAYDIIGEMKDAKSQVACRLTLHFAAAVPPGTPGSRGLTVTRCDVGAQSDQPDIGDKMKSAFTDAFKRAAVKFGIGRYIGHLPKVWTPCKVRVGQDGKPVLNQKGKMEFKEFIKAPALPGWAVPAGTKPTTDPPPPSQDETSQPGLPREEEQLTGEDKAKRDLSIAGDLDSLKQIWNACNKAFGKEPVARERLAAIKDLRKYQLEQLKK
jgi:hypothetical protein